MFVEIDIQVKLNGNVVQDIQNINEPYDLTDNEDVLEIDDYRLFKIDETKEAEEGKIVRRIEKRILEKTNLERNVWEENQDSIEQNRKIILTRI